MFNKLRNYTRLSQIIFKVIRYSPAFSTEIRKHSLILAMIAKLLPRPGKNLSKGQALAELLEKLGPFFIKFGQSISTRADIIGSDVAYDLARLRDHLAPFPGKIARQIIEQQIGGKIEDHFAEFDENAVASASVAQVHKATTTSGKKVAVKVLRPKIEEDFARDIALLYFITDYVETHYPEHKRLRLRQVIDSFVRTTNFEMDLRFEAAAASELKDNLILDDFIYIPEVDWARTSKQVLTLEWVDGISIGDKDRLIEAGHNLDDLASKVAVCFFNQAYRDGFFHADMHQGNILINPQGQIILVDFGIMGRLDDRTRIYIAEILRGFLTRDYLYVAQIHFDAGYVPPHHSVKDFAMGCRSIGEAIVGLPANQISVAKLLAQLFRITEAFDMETQPQLLLLQKTTMLVEGVGSSLDPKVNMWSLADPWIKEWASENLGLQAKAKRRIGSLIDAISHKLTEAPKPAYEPEQVIIYKSCNNRLSSFITAAVTTILTYIIITKLF